MKYKLISERDDGTIIDDIELAYYEYKQAITLHKRLKQRKER
jgi:hypothetical protein